MRPSSVSYSPSTAFAHIRKRSLRSSTSLRAGITCIAATPHSTTDRRRPSSGKPLHDFPISNYPRKPGNFTTTLPDFNSVMYRIQNARNASEKKKRG